jgi:16S rRNA (uracil1498-N3)-methyltransferase
VRAPGETVELDEGDARKARVVLRLETGAAVEAIDSAGVSYAGSIAVDEAGVRVRLERALERAAEARLRITLAQGVPKGQKMDFIVEKGTELGVAAFAPFFAARSLGERVGGAKLERWRRIARSASAQSGRTAVPDVREPLAWPALLDAFAGFDRVLVAWEVAQREPLLAKLAGRLAGAASLLLVIGPEGGLTHGEAGEARERGAEIISLGPRILRTETAGIVAATALLLCTGDL